MTEQATNLQDLLATTNKGGHLRRQIVRQRCRCVLWRSESRTLHIWRRGLTVIAALLVREVACLDLLKEENCFRRRLYIQFLGQGLAAERILGQSGATLAAQVQQPHQLAVRLLAPELLPPSKGLMRVRDPETGAETLVDWSSRRVRDAYSARVARWRSETASAFRRANVDVMDVPVPRVPDPEAIAQPILRLFRMRELRGAKR